MIKVVDTLKNQTLLGVWACFHQCKCDLKSFKLIKVLLFWLFGSFAYLLLVSLLQELHVAPPLTLGSPQGGAPMLGQVRGRRHAPALRIHPGVNVVGDVAAGNPPHRAHGERKLFTALQHLKGNK